MQPIHKCQTKHWKILQPKRIGHLMATSYLKIQEMESKPTFLRLDVPPIRIDGKNDHEVISLANRSP